MSEKMKIERPRGTRDFLPEEMRRRRAVEEKMRMIAERWSYEEIKTPVFEYAELFTLKSGEEIIKEMYDFYDKSNRHLVLRPELTAPVIRMFVNEMKMRPRPLKLYYFGNCFRYERPQSSRYREFWQFGAEIIGSDNEYAEAEIIALSYHILKSLDVKMDLQIGHIGVIRSVLEGIKEDDKRKLMRYIDSGNTEEMEDFLRRISQEDKIESLREIIDLRGDESVIEDGRRIVSRCSENSRKEGYASLDELEKLLEILNFYDVEYDLNIGIARGLDYYTGMVFEIYAEGLGAENQICGGGSYRLSSVFGGDDTPSTGFAIGFDRVMDVLRNRTYRDDERSKKIIVAIASREREVIKKAIEITMELRKKFRTYIDLMNRSLKSQLSFADTINASHVLIIGKKEVEEGKITLKEMNTSEQRMVSLEECISILGG